MLAMRRIGWAWGVILLTSLAGCTPPQKEVGAISGTVTASGKPFEGAIVFTPIGGAASQKSFETKVEGGRYEIADVPVGEVTVEVFPAHHPNQMVPDPALVAALPRPITFTVKPGAQTLDLKGPVSR